VEGKSYNGVMPPFRQLKDQEVADVLNYVLTTFAKSKSKAKPITAAEVKAARAKALSPQDVLKSRPPVK
jgi:mono/diheme cytochrome c family protein